MNKKVYLFELDSVRKTDVEIQIAQKALYDEIVINGNVVVMTFNQFADSRGFFSLLQDENYRNNLISLFEKGAIRISQFKDTKTLCQYLLNSIDDEKEFLFSALPIKYSQKHLKALVKRALIYSDLTELYEYFDEEDKEKKHKAKREDWELAQLFVEYEDNGEIKETSKIKEIDKNVKLEVDVRKQLQDKLKELYHLLYIILRISPINKMYTYPKRVEEYNSFNLQFYLNVIFELEFKEDNYLNRDNGIDLSVFNKAKAFLKDTIIPKLNNSTNRSEYIRTIKEVYDKGEVEKIIGQYAEVIVDLCYNYASETSIRNISKHYDFEEIKSDKTHKPTFQHDFEHRFVQAWNNGNPDEKYLQEDNDEFELFDAKTNPIKDFGVANRIIQYTKYTFDEIEEENSKAQITQYEFELGLNQENQKNTVRKGIRQEILITLIYATIAVVIDQVLSWLIGFLPVGKVLVLKRFPQILLIIVFVLLNGIIYLSIFISSLILTAVISDKIERFLKKRFPGYLTFSESLSKLKQLWDDRKIVKDFGSLYYEVTDSKEKRTEDYNPPKLIGRIYSPAMQQYGKLRKGETLRNDKTHRLFLDDNEHYALVNTSKEDIESQITSDEEIKNHTYGLVYKSKYNMLLVDPVLQNGKIIPYERVVSSIGKEGVVMVVRHNDNFILLKQFRHSIRCSQYAFPRGFMEESSKYPEDDAKRELEEEIGAVIIEDPKLIGIVSPDSGLSSRCAYVYLCDIESYDTGKKDEGISEILEVSDSDIKHMITRGDIKDGFTISAYTLYQLKK